MTSQFNGLFETFQSFQQNRIECFGSCHDLLQVGIVDRKPFVIQAFVQVYVYACIPGICEHETKIVMIVLIFVFLLVTWDRVGIDFDAIGFVFNEVDGN